MSSKAWGGRFTKSPDKLVEGFCSSLSFDRRLYRQDIRGSIAHARMLGRQGIISEAETRTLVEGLEKVLAEIEAGTFPFRIEHEDIHLNIEKRLTELVGPAGGKLHTARSRNDQVSTDMHLYFKEEIIEVIGLVRGLQRAILGQAEQHLTGPTIMPGYTHLQRAQPILLSHHLMAYFFMFERDAGRLADCRKRADLSPLGAGALAGTTFPIDREFTAREMGLAAPYPNTIDAVSDRDYLIEFLSAASLIMAHLSRLCEELVMWSGAEFAFVEMDDAYATGSSIMPQKKNPDVAELVRGKTGRVYGSLIGLLTVLKGLPLAYHTDLQEDKERTFDALDTVKRCLEVTAGMAATMQFRRDRLAEAVRCDFSNATDLADYLAKKGLPFREAHEAAGKLVLLCITTDRYLADLTLDEMRQFSGLIDEDIYAAISPERCVADRRSFGGTAPERVAEQIALARRLLEAEA